MQEVQLGGKTFISVRRAAEITGYTRDYIGQLARSGKIESQRVGRSWYVTVDSLASHQKVAQEYTPQPPEVVQNLGPDVIVSLDGLEYISSRRAAQISQYSQDYVTQLARAGRIQSKSVGGRWFVAREELLSHKKESEAALARAQVESVGVYKPQAAEPLFQEELLSYSSVEGDLFPAFASKPKEDTSESRTILKTRIVENTPRNIDISRSKTLIIPARKIGEITLARPAPTVLVTNYSNARQTSGALSSVYVPIFVGVLAAAMSIIFALQAISPRHSTDSTVASVSRSLSLSTFKTLMEDLVDSLIGKDLHGKNTF